MIPRILLCVRMMLRAIDMLALRPERTVPRPRRAVPPEREIEMRIVVTGGDEAVAEIERIRESLDRAREAMDAIGLDRLPRDESSNMAPETTRGSPWAAATTIGETT